MLALTTSAFAPCSNTCFDWGTFGGALRSGQVEAARYRYIVMVNSSVRGPFLPAYWPVRGRRSTLDFGLTLGLASTTPC